MTSFIFLGGFEVTSVKIHHWEWQKDQCILAAKEKIQIIDSSESLFKYECSVQMFIVQIAHTLLAKIFNVTRNSRKLIPHWLYEQSLECEIVMWWGGGDTEYVCPAMCNTKVCYRHNFSLHVSWDLGTLKVSEADIWKFVIRKYYCGTKNAWYFIGSNFTVRHFVNDENLFCEIKSYNGIPKICTVKSLKPVSVSGENKYRPDALKPYDQMHSLRDFLIFSSVFNFGNIPQIYRGENKG